MDPGLLVILLESPVEDYGLVKADVDSTYRSVTGNPPPEYDVTMLADEDFYKKFLGLRREESSANPEFTIIPHSADIKPEVNIRKGSKMVDVIGSAWHALGHIKASRQHADKCVGETLAYLYEIVMMENFLESRRIKLEIEYEPHGELQRTAHRYAQALAKLPIGFEEKERLLLGCKSREDIENMTNKYAGSLQVS